MRLFEFLQSSDLVKNLTYTVADMLLAEVHFPCSHAQNVDMCFVCCVVQVIAFELTIICVCFNSQDLSLMWLVLQLFPEMATALDGIDYLKRSPSTS